MDVALLPRHLVRRVGALAASAAVAASLAVVGVVTSAAPAGAADDIVVYERDQTIPVPPASTYSGSAGGDGWNVALSDTEVFNVFHHSSQVTVACHKQSDATECYPARTLTDGAFSFGASGHSAAYYDAPTQHVYIFTVRSDNTGGVVCFDATTASSNPNPFCGFTPLTAVGHAVGGGTPYISQGAKVGDRWFAYSWVNGMGAVGDQNALLCFDFSTHAACAGQPFSPALGGATVSVGNFPPPPTTAIGGRIIVGFDGSTGDQLTCFDASTNATCSGAWPAAAPSGYIGGAGTPFHLLNGGGDTIGFCLPFGTDPCYDFSGAATPTPAGLAAAVPQTSGWNGSSLTVGSRVYVPNGNQNRVECYNAGTSASCQGFPKTFNNLSLLYTVNPDPARPECLWVNADSGDQINNFDAFTGGGCGQGPLRVLGSSFVAPADKCVPGSYVTLRVLNPPRNAYSSGSVKFLDGDANQLPIADKAIDNAGAVDLNGLNLNSNAGLPQFLVTLNGIQPSSVTLRLTWKGKRDPDCVLAGTHVSENVTSGRCHGLEATIRGTDAADKIIGTPGDDVIVGFGGNDTIRGRGGRDIICGRSGEDTVIGGVGDDIYLSGGAGNDKVSGGSGDDHLFGRDDKDLVRGGEGNDEIHGNAQNDFVMGGKGNDAVDGGYGNDTVVGNQGTNVLRGGPGKDLCTPVNAKNKAINC